jgi:hypothetical protein
MSIPNIRENIFKKRVDYYINHIAKDLTDDTINNKKYTILCPYIISNFNINYSSYSTDSIEFYFENFYQKLNNSSTKRECSEHMISYIHSQIDKINSSSLTLPPDCNQSINILLEKI